MKRIKEYSIKRLLRTLPGLFLCLLCMEACAFLNLEEGKNTAAELSVYAEDEKENEKRTPSNDDTWTFSLEDIPAYSGEPYIELNGNQPVFSPEEYTEDVFARFSALDDLGRCGPACVNVCQETIPSEPRGVIGDIRPSGWHTVKYPDRIEDQYLYNRCHLVAYQLCGENANERNLITGTRYMNVSGMLPFENRVYAYVTAYEGHVLYRATPRFAGDDLVAAGVELEAASVEDGGKGLSFHVFVYNVQPGVLIDYSDGESTEDPDYIVRSIPEDQQEDQSENNQQEDQSGEKQQTDQSRENKDPSGQSLTREPDAVPENVTYVGNANSRKFHLPDCSSVTDMAEHNKVYFTGTREEVLEAGFDPCKRCNP